MPKPVPRLLSGTQIQICYSYVSYARLCPTVVHALGFIFLGTCRVDVANVYRAAFTWTPPPLRQRYTLASAASCSTPASRREIKKRPVVDLAGVRRGSC